MKLTVKCGTRKIIRIRINNQNDLNHICRFIKRGLATGIYTTNTPEACQYVAENCEANVLVVENHKQLIKILQVGSSPFNYSKQSGNTFN